MGYVPLPTCLSNRAAPVTRIVICLCFVLLPHGVSSSFHTRPPPPSHRSPSRSLNTQQHKRPQAHLFQGAENLNGKVRTACDSSSSSSSLLPAIPFPLALTQGSPRNTHTHTSLSLSLDIGQVKGHEITTAYTCTSTHLPTVGIGWKGPDRDGSTCRWQAAVARRGRRVRSLGATSPMANPRA